MSLAFWGEIWHTPGSNDEAPVSDNGENFDLKIHYPASSPTTSDKLYGGLPAGEDQDPGEEREVLIGRASAKWVRAIAGQEDPQEDPETVYLESNTEKALSWIAKIWGR